MKLNDLGWKRFDKSSKNEVLFCKEFEDESIIKCNYCSSNNMKDFNQWVGYIFGSQLIYLATEGICKDCGNITGGNPKREISKEDFEELLNEYMNGD